MMCLILLCVIQAFWRFFLINTKFSLIKYLEFVSSILDVCYKLTGIAISLIGDGILDIAQTKV